MASYLLSMSYHPQSLSGDSHNSSKKRKRINNESEELAWTAARCSRLLRSITSRIAAIRKLVDSNRPTEVTKPKKTVAKRAANHWSTQDPVWMGDAKRKTGSKTFARRKKVTKSEAPKEAVRSAVIAFPSPFVRRMGRGESSSPAVPFIQPAAPPPRQTRQLPIKPESPLEEAERGLASAFSSILTATKEQGSPKPRGARSLMSTCLKNVPQYIALLEEDENDEDIDSASEIVRYLEDLGTKENGGWSGLREVVRSQAVYSICEAIEDGMLSESVIRQLIDQCGSQNSTPEGHDILTAWIGARDSVTAKQIETLNCFGRDQNCTGSTFRLMQGAGIQKSARLEAFCKTPGFWNNMLGSLSRASHFDSESYLSTCLRYCSESGVNCSHGLGLGMKEIMIKLTTMAASAILLSDTLTGHGSLHHLLHRLAAVVVFSDQRSHPGELGRVLISCSLFLLGVVQGSHGSLSRAGLSDMLSSIATTRTCRPYFADEIISSITTLEHHLKFDMKSLILERMVEQASAAPLFGQIALAAIEAKQQSSGSDDDDAALYADYINRISKPSSPPSSIPQTPFRKPSRAQFRWEDGICEWVAKTPFTAAAIAPPTPTSIPMVAPNYNDDKENCWISEETSSISTKDACLLQNSPDVLTLSPQKWTKVESPLRPRQAKRKKLSNSRSAVQQKLGETRRTSRLSSKSCEADESADELGF